MKLVLQNYSTTKYLKKTQATKLAVGGGSSHAAE